MKVSGNPEFVSKSRSFDVIDNLSMIINLSDDNLLSKLTLHISLKPMSFASGVISRPVEIVLPPVLTDYIPLVPNKRT